MRVLLAALVTICAAGCTTSAEGKSFARARAAPADGKAVVYVFRKDAKPTVFGATLCIDEWDVVTLQQGGFTWTYLSPGSHQVKVRWPTMSGAPDPSIELDAAAGRTYYYELTGSVPSGPLVAAAAPFVALVMIASWSTLQESELKPTAPREAESTMSQFCKFQEPNPHEW
jgi:hypothetical protein